MNDGFTQQIPPVLQSSQLNQTAANRALVKLDGIKIHFPVGGGWPWQPPVGMLKAVDDLTLDIYPGETLGLVGESGCGKTTTGRAILQLIRPTAGHIYFDGIDLAQAKGESLRNIRRRMQLIFQDPYASLNPRMTIGKIIEEPLIIHTNLRSPERRHQVEQWLTRVGLDPSFANRYPHEFSGGQRQRVAIARALVLNPDFVVCDEPVAALDVSVQAQIINLMRHLQTKLGLTFLFIAHDLSVVRHISDRVAVMYLGKLVELADCDALYQTPLHPYTQALLSAVPIPDPAIEATRHRQLLADDLTNRGAPSQGCIFQHRCPLATDACRVDPAPSLRDVGDQHWVACHWVTPTSA